MLRRNGKLRSCEPCRISKIKCDHATPTCAKCEARGMSEQCFYHPNPMTKPAGTPRKRPEPRRRKGNLNSSDANASQGLRRLTSLVLSPPTLRNEVDTTAVSGTWPTPPETTPRTTHTGADTARSFYLGSTSYASVFTEDRPLPDSVHHQPSERMSLTPSSISSKSIGGTRHCQMGAGHTVVARLSPFSFYETSLKMYFETSLGTPLLRPLIMSMLPQLRDDVRQLTAAGPEASQMYVQMTKNTVKPLNVPPTMLPSEWHTQVTGSNLRWETLGLVLVLAAFNAQFAPPEDPIFTLEDGMKLHKDDFVEDTIQAVNDCITICQVHGAVNDVMVWLVYIQMLVVSNFYGDNYHGTWRRIGESISCMYATGIHCESENASREPPFLREARRRIHAAIYRSDKTFAIFFGRPPMMAWRYSDRKQMFDVSEEAVCSDDSEDLDRAIAMLDPAGWSKEGKLYPASILRLRTQHAVYKERLLEQSLAGDKDHAVISNLQTISAECAQFWDSVPAHLRYDSYTEEGAWHSLGPRVTFRLISTYLDHLHMHFQIQRMLHRLTQQALPDLLEVSLKLLSTALDLTKPNNSAMYETRRHFPTTILFFCMPAAGVLALELRRCTIERCSLPNTISRADIIRNLSVLTSCLEWIVLPGDGNHKLCSELNKMLTMVLDEVLNYQSPAANEQPDGNDVFSGAGSGFFDMPLIEGLEPIPTEAEDFLNWLDNATWSNNVTLF
ncbi:hypothetical protein FB567DRAFT_535117 [Paraphoma chrysanthemicola]|uniref:Zn(2)-C6 fungal-type domain-containing protein n=1 Tax=Paraphoma chrysanthemicola TaxID=798071 RepID=A0A8K0QZI1_9PLEO|nr:hypothetical protein FB567DRAFT_535117 [Paraphoma chrysanthemicola]